MTDQMEKAGPSGAMNVVLSVKSPSPSSETPLSPTRPLPRAVPTSQSTAAAVTRSRSRRRVPGWWSVCWVIASPHGGWRTTPPGRQD